MQSVENRTGTERKKEKNKGDVFIHITVRERGCLQLRGKIKSISKTVLAASKKEPKFYTRKEAAEILHVTLPTLARITKDGLLISKRVGSRILYEADAIDEAVKKQVVFKYRRA